MFALFAAALPILFWQAGPDTAPALKQAGITHIAVPAARAEAWKAVSGITVESASDSNARKLPPPGIEIHIREASASRVPWVDSNGWRLIRWPNGRFLYNVTDSTAALAAAEAFCYNAHAWVHMDAGGLHPFASMLQFFRSIPPFEGEAVADVGFIDDGSPIDAEVMNLLVRDNLLFKIVRSPQPDLKLTVRIGSKRYPKQEARNPNVTEHKIRADLTDARRTIRIYGTSVVIARVVRGPQRARIQLLSYGAARNTRVGAFRVRILGRYSKARLYSFGNASAKLADYTVRSDATEFTVPGLKVYAAIDLSK
jgi:hypothetical protein